jgi:hypothetical protein
MRFLWATAVSVDAGHEPHFVAPTLPIALTVSADRDHRPDQKAPETNLQARSMMARPTRIVVDSIQTAPGIGCSFNIRGCGGPQ